jgi:hypothetical protein
LHWSKRREGKRVLALGEGAVVVDGHLHVIACKELETIVSESTEASKSARCSIALITTGLCVFDIDSRNPVKGERKWASTLRGLGKGL